MQPPSYDTFCIFVDYRGNNVYHAKVLAGNTSVDILNVYALEVDDVQRTCESIGW